jgi:hypothetical protein
MACLVMALGSAMASAQETPAAAQAGVLKGVQGQVTVQSASGVKRSVASGDTIAETERIITAEKSSAGLVLGDGTVITVGSGSQVDFSKFSFNSTTHEGNLVVRVVTGSMRMITGLLAKLKQEAVQVITGTTTIGVRGTDFIVEVKP